VEAYIYARPLASLACEAAALQTLPGLRQEEGSLRPAGSGIERGGWWEILLLQQKMVLQLLDRYTVYSCICPFILSYWL
jgi:hypothetical protein